MVSAIELSQCYCEVDYDKHVPYDEKLQVILNGSSPNVLITFGREIINIQTKDSLFTHVQKLLFPLQNFFLKEYLGFHPHSSNHIWCHLNFSKNILFFQDISSKRWVEGKPQKNVRKLCKITLKFKHFQFFFKKTEFRQITFWERLLFETRSMKNLAKRIQRSINFAHRAIETFHAKKWILNKWFF